MNEIPYPDTHSVNGTLTYANGVASYRYRRLDLSELVNRTDTVDLIHVARLIGAPVASARLFVSGPVVNATVGIRVSGDASSWTASAATATVNSYSATVLDTRAIRFLDAAVTVLDDGEQADVTIVMQAAQ